MKLVELEKNKGLKIINRAKQSEMHASPGQVTVAGPDRREQRRIDQSLGLVPFAVKINIELVKRIQAQAQSRNVGLNEVVAELLKKGLDG